MFTPEERLAVRERVFALAREDPRVSGGAITGSGSVGEEDEWSDVDTSFGVVDGVEPLEVLEDWTRQLDAGLGFVHWWDLHHGATIYRVYLLPSSLELDIAVTPAARWAQRGPKFQLVFGEAAEATEVSRPNLDDVIGVGWLAALDARMAIERGRPWQGLAFVNMLRDRTLALACIRAGEAYEYARGADRLPPEITRPLAAALPRSLEADELRRALAAGTSALLGEVEQVRPELAQRLRAALVPPG